MLRFEFTAPVMPVLVIEEPADAVPVARALVAGGLTAVEITLRTHRALEAIRAVRDEVPEAVVGAGTVLRAGDAERAVAAGARFLVSPGCSAGLLAAFRASGVPCLPGVSTASEVQVLHEQEVRDFKFFPAEAAGGTRYLRSLAGPFPAARFCPTGGITAAAAPDYLALPNVACVGGSWLLPPDVLAARDWGRVTALAAAAAVLAGPAAR
ncbi:bifunctional 4-hydroxy-2-oxoglutarate aldolase/2-dehydro-3-deoxy-phosphogluconate aldolase [Streptomyces sp. NPDC089919]|uniref:bifunctional 4-hydroxy-2-oxoglutarate aldolase/2-dehydro-3-deoxy-phosphogluconate aldolase n=1 Tax=Streptomyces sp. NPDC089919 TaxID=3155188 RepID=UPI0034251105